MSERPSVRVLHVYAYTHPLCHGYQYYAVQGRTVQLCYNGQTVQLCAKCAHCTVALQGHTVQVCITRDTLNNYVTKDKLYSCRLKKHTLWLCVTGTHCIIVCYKGCVLQGDTV